MAIRNESANLSERKKDGGTVVTDEKGSVSREHDNRIDSDVESYEKDAEFGGSEARRRLEKKLLLKVDLRMSILVLIYILNYVSSYIHVVVDNLTDW